MQNLVTIRESKDSDAELIRQVHRNAFGAAEGESVSQLAVDLLEDETALPLLSLVAQRANEIVGSVIFSAVKVPGANVAISILAPVAVAEDVQGTGIGTRLIKHGLQLLEKRGIDIVLVYGNPAYYSRTGFHADHQLQPPYELAYPEAWMAQELREGALESVKGTVQCARSLSAPEHW